MSGKSRRRGRHLPQTKKRKISRDRRALVASAPVAAQPSQTPPRAGVPLPVTKTSVYRVPGSRAASATLPNVGSELRRIGIMAGIIGVILLALYFFLS